MHISYTVAWIQLGYLHFLLEVKKLQDVDHQCGTGLWTGCSYLNMLLCNFTEYVWDLDDGTECELGKGLHQSKLWQEDEEESWSEEHHVHLHWHGQTVHITEFRIYTKRGLTYSWYVKLYMFKGHAKLLYSEFHQSIQSCPYPCPFTYRGHSPGSSVHPEWGWPLQKAASWPQGH